MHIAHSDGYLLSCAQEHNHSPDLADCEAKAVLSSMKEIAATKLTPNHLIYAQTTGSLSQATLSFFYKKLFKILG